MLRIGGDHTPKRKQELVATTQQKPKPLNPNNEDRIQQNRAIMHVQELKPGDNSSALRIGGDHTTKQRQTQIGKGKRSMYIAQGQDSPEH